MPLQVHFSQNKSDHFDGNQNKPEHKQRIAQLASGHVVGKYRHNQRRAYQRCAADISSEPEKNYIDQRISAAKRLIENITKGISGDYGENNPAHYMVGQRDQTEHAGKFGPNHDQESAFKIHPVNAAVLFLAGVPTVILNNCDAGENQQMNGNNRQIHQRTIVDQQQKRHGHKCATESQTRTHKATPGEYQADQKLLP